MSDTREPVSAMQEQATAAWIGHLNQVRLDALLERLAKQDVNLSDALTHIDEALKKIDLEVVATNRGGTKGMHGFIAEVAEVGVGNARARVVGAEAVYEWVNDNGPVDLLRGGQAIQQKFVAAGGRLGLGAIAEHLERYPSFVADGGRYQIPADHYEVIRTLHAMPREEAGKLVSGAADGPSFRDWKRVHAFFATNELDIDALEASTLDYKDVQRGAYGASLEAEEDSLRRTDRELRDRARAESGPSLREGAQATLVAAAIEGGSAFVLAVIAKRREGTKLAEFTADDWKEISGRSGLAAAKGGVRGAGVYAITNTIPTSAAVASSIVTAAISVAEQAHKLRSGEITEAQFLENAEYVCLESAVGALSALVGQVLIPVPLLGAVIGTTIGSVMYRAAAASLDRREAELIARFRDEQIRLDAHLAAEHQQLLEQIGVSTARYIEVLDLAFSPDLGVALQGSIALAAHVGVAADQILDTEDKTLSYFVD